MSKSRLFVLAALFNAMPLWPQSYQGGVRGKVTDITAGAVDVAKVTLTAESTGVSRATLSNAAGEFVFNAVDPATYRITIEAAGFKRFERSFQRARVRFLPSRIARFSSTRQALPACRRPPISTTTG